MKTGSALEAEALLLIRAAGLPEPTLQYPLGREHGRRWTMDFAWPEQRVALEVDGGAIIHRKVHGRVVMVPGRHNSDEGREADAVRDAYAQLTGWLVFRATPRLLRHGCAIEWARAAIEKVRAQDQSGRLVDLSVGPLVAAIVFPKPAALRPKEHARKRAKARAAARARRAQR